MADDTEQKDIGLFKRDSELFVNIEKLLFNNLDDSSVTSVLEVTQTMLFMHGFGIFPTNVGVGIIFDTRNENYEDLLITVSNYLGHILSIKGHTDSVLDNFLLINSELKDETPQLKPAALATLCNSACFEVSRMLVAKSSGMSVEEHTKSIDGYMAEYLRKQAKEES